MTHEDELIRQIKKGSQECLDELIRLYYPAILRYCLWHMPDRESAQDAVQETFLKLARFIGRYEENGFQLADDRQQLATAFCSLEGEAKELVLLKYGQELTLREIAAITGLPLRTVQTRLRRAIRTMRRILDG